MDKNNKLKNKLEMLRKVKNHETSKQYYENHKNELIARGCEKVECDKCGKHVSRNNLQKHKNTKLCFKLSSLV